MLFEHVRIVGLAHVDAPERVTSAELDEQLAPALERFGVRPGLLEGLSGIVARRYWPMGTMPSDAATLAAEKLFAEIDVDRAEVGVCVNTSVCRDYLEPSTACLVHSKLGLSSDCLNYDLGNACLAFLNAMDLVSNLIERGVIRYGLIVDGENSRHVTQSTIERILRGDSTADQYRNQFASLTLGSGGAAMLLAHADTTDSQHRYLGCTNQAATEWSHLCRGQADFMETDTRTLLEQGLALAHRTLKVAEQERGWVVDELDEFVLHQVSRVHTEQLTSLLNVPQGRYLTIFEEFGNIGPAAVPIALSKSVQAGRIEPGMRVALMGIGSGLNCSMGEIVW
ncbi:MAG TPA: 3-oxoacyl-ACP synthase III [Myxococcales bacterium]|nr:3-oxoacyl-ACP synthase III [Myxococcales bacterium]HAN32229.1 3-oxoacyl-ACP synthase III [Myxococcales bacterium]